MSKQLLSKIPAINKILLLDKVKSLIQEYSEVAVKSAIKNYIDEIKQEILNEELHEVPSLEKIVVEVTQIVKKTHLMVTFQHQESIVHGKNLTICNYQKPI